MPKLPFRKCAWFLSCSLWETGIPQRREAEERPYRLVASRGKSPYRDCHREAHHKTLDGPPRPCPSPPSAVGTFDQGDDCRPGVSCACATIAPSLAVVGGTDGRHRDADEHRTVAKGNVR